MSRQGWVVALGALGLAVALGFWFLRSDRLPADDARAAGERVVEPAAQSTTDLEQPSERADVRKHVAPSLSAQAPNPVAEPLELLVTSDELTPVPAARLVIFRDEEILASGSTDAAGLAQFPSVVGSAEVAVFAQSWPVARFPIELGSGRRTLTLPRGAILGGQVLVDGARPAESIGLWFTPGRSKDLFPYPKSVVARLKPLSQTGNSLAGNLGFQFTTADANGAFVFRSVLPEPGTLTWDGPYVLDLASESESSEIWNVRKLTLGAPRTDVELLLTRGIQLITRVVDSSGLAVPRASVDLNVIVRSDQSHSFSMLRGEADEQGRFQTLIGRKPPTEVLAIIARPDGIGQAMHKLICPPEVRGTWDVGDLALEANHLIQMHVQDDSDKPISDASAVSLPSNRYSKARSDANGNFELGLRLEDQQVLVQALGYQNAIVDVASDATAATAILTRACLLVFTMPEDEAVERRFLSLTVAGDPPLFKDELSGSRPLLQDIGTSSSSENDERGTSRYTTSSTADGRWKIAGLMPGIALKARLDARNGPTLAQLDIEPLSVGEHRTVELAMNRRPRSLRVQVKAPDQTPVSGARVVLLFNARGRGSPATELDPGTYRFSSLYAESFTTLSIETAGYPTKYLHSVAVPPEEITVVLDPPRALEIELVHLDGSPVLEETRISASESSSAMKQGKPTSPGHWIVSELPAGEVAIHVEGNAGSLDCLHDMSFPSRKLVLGEHGCVVARATIPDDEQDREWSISICPEGDTKALARQQVSQGSLNGLAFGSHDLWLEQRAAKAPWEWRRVGSATRVVLDADHPKVEIDLLR